MEKELNALKKIKLKKCLYILGPVYPYPFHRKQIIKSCIKYHFRAPEYRKQFSGANRPYFRQHG
jgi:hypothetical protein